MGTLKDGRFQPRDDASGAGKVGSAVAARWALRFRIRPVEGGWEGQHGFELPSHQLNLAPSVGGGAWPR
ncbi:hypothetical protein L0F63_005555 [Massospora cicadina]|nr:hypothetical protein L0F63_005555 [Massospora cicadina]